jgi:hypothetical protein
VDVKEMDLIRIENIEEVYNYVLKWTYVYCDLIKSI